MTSWTSATWTTDEFRAEVRAFVAEALGPSVELEPLSVQPWSTVWRCRAGNGTYYPKQNCPGRTHEARLLQVLSRAGRRRRQLVPDRRRGGVPPARPLAHARLLRVADAALEVWSDLAPASALRAARAGRVVATVRRDHDPAERGQYGDIRPAGSA